MKSSIHRVVLVFFSAVLLMTVSCAREEAPPPRPAATQEEEPIAPAYKDPRCKNQEQGPFQVVIINEALPAPPRKFRPEVVCVSRSRGEQVIWVAAGKADLDIDFPTDTPFEEGGKPKKNYSVARGASIRSGPIGKDVPAVEFTYDVRVKDGPVVDPRIVVED